MKLVSGTYTQAQLVQNIREAEMVLRNRFLSQGPITNLTEQSDYKMLIESNSFGRNTVLYDDVGNPSIMVLLPSMSCGDVLGTTDYTPLHAFIVNGSIVPILYISKYLGTVYGMGVDARAVSLPLIPPTTNIAFINAAAACSQKGTGWHLMTNPEYVAVSHSAWARSYLPRGNTYKGTDKRVSREKGIVFANEPLNNMVLNGSGPHYWTHDGTPFGIYDINGFAGVWVNGLQLVDGEIQIFADNEGVDPTYNVWVAILEDGSLVAPGTVGTLKYDSTGLNGSGRVVVNTVLDNPHDESSNYADQEYRDVVAADGVSIPDIMKLLALFPHSDSLPNSRIIHRSSLTRIAWRGKAFPDSSPYEGSIFSLTLERPGSSVSFGIGFRSVYVEV